MHSKQQQKKKNPTLFEKVQQYIYIHICILLPVSISLYLYTWWRYNTAKTNLAVKK